ncbi:hypothetical protein quinque_000892 [Culex quinquefasciatus]
MCWHFIIRGHQCVGDLERAEDVAGGRSFPDWSGEEEGINRHEAGHHRAIGSVWRRGMNMPIFSSGALDAGRNFIIRGHQCVGDLERAEDVAGGRSFPDWSGEEEGINRHEAGHHRAIGSVWRRGMNMPIFSSGALDAGRNFIIRGHQCVGDLERAEDVAGGRSSSDWSGEEKGINRHEAGHHRAIGSVWRRGMNMPIFSSGALDAGRNFIIRGHQCVGDLERAEDVAGGRSFPDWSGEEEGINRHEAGHHRAIGSVWRRGINMPIFSSGALDAGRSFLRFYHPWPSMRWGSRTSRGCRRWPIFPDWSGEEEGINRHEAGHHRAIGSVWRRGMNMPIFSSGALDAGRNFIIRGHQCVGDLERAEDVAGGRSFPDWSGEEEGINRHEAGHHRAIGSVWRRGMNMPIFSSGALDAGRNFIIRGHQCVGDLERAEDVAGGRSFPDWSGEEEGINRHEAGHHRAIGSVWRRGMNMPIFSSGALDAGRNFIIRGHQCVGDLERAEDVAGGRSSPDWSGEEEGINRHEAGHHRAIGSVWRRGMNMPIFSSGALDAGRNFIIRGHQCVGDLERAEDVAGGRSFPDWSGEEEGINRHEAGHHRAIGSVWRRGMNMPIFSSGALDAGRNFIIRGHQCVGDLERAEDVAGGRSFPDWSGEEEGINRHEAGHHRAIGSVWRRGMNMPIFSSGALDAGRNFIIRGHQCVGDLERAEDVAGGRSFPDWSGEEEGINRHEAGHHRAIGSVWRRGMNMPIFSSGALDAGRNFIIRGHQCVGDLERAEDVAGGRSSPDWSGEEEGINRHEAGHHRAIGSVWRRGMNMPIFSSGALDAGRNFIIRGHQCVGDLERAEDVAGGRSFPDWSGEEEGINRHEAGHHRAIGSILSFVAINALGISNEPRMSPVADLPRTGRARRKESTGMKLAIIVPSVRSGDEE